MDKQSLNTIENDLTYGRGYVYLLQYHIVWCTKYRRKVLVDTVRSDMIDYLRIIADEYKFTIDSMEVMPDHIHMLISCSPQFYIPNMMRIIKGNTARWLFIKHPEVKQQLWGGHLWNPSYCVVTVSDRSIEQVRHYIETQTER